MTHAKVPLLFILAVGFAWAVSANPVSSEEPDKTPPEVAVELADVAPGSMQAWHYATVASYPPDGLGVVTRSGEWRTFINSRPVDGRLTDVLNALGRQGWEAVGYSHQATSQWVLLKRPR